MARGPVPARHSGNFLATQSAACLSDPRRRHMAIHAVLHHETTYQYGTLGRAAYAGVRLSF